MARGHGVAWRDGCGEDGARATRKPHAFDAGGMGGCGMQGGGGRGKGKGVWDRGGKHGAVGSWCVGIKEAMGLSSMAQAMDCVSPAPMRSSTTLRQSHTRHPLLCLLPRLMA